MPHITASSLNQRQVILVGPIVNPKGMTMVKHITISAAPHPGEHTGRALTDTDLDHVFGGTAAPGDVATNNATGRRVELPIRVTTPIGAAS